VVRTSSIPGSQATAYRPTPPTSTCSRAKGSST
jgi:hypothetical protein